MTYIGKNAEQQK